MARVEAGQEYFREAVTTMKEGQDRLARRLDALAEEVRRSGESTSREMHDAALAMERVAARLDAGAEHMKDDADQLRRHEARIDSLETTRTRQSAYVAAAGFLGAGALWVVEGLFKVASSFVK